MRHQLVPVARKTEPMNVRIDPGQKVVLDAVAEARGQGISELVRVLVFERVQEAFLTDVLGPVLHAAMVGAPSKAGSINPGGKPVEIQTADKQKMSSLAIWIRGSPLTWRTAQGYLMPSEKKVRLELLTEYGGDALEDWLGTRNPPVSLETFCEAMGYMDRLTFATELLGYRPQPKVEASKAASGLAELGQPRSKKRGVSARPLKRV